MTLLPLTLTQIFGNNASQDEFQLIIHKADLPKLTTSSNNSAEQLLVAVCLKSLENFQGYLFDENDILFDENDIPLEFDNTKLFLLLSIFVWELRFDRRNNQLYAKNTIVVHQYESMA